VVGKEETKYDVDTCPEPIYRGSCDDELERVGGNGYACGGSTSPAQRKIGKACPIIISKFTAVMEQVGALEWQNFSLATTGDPAEEHLLSEKVADTELE
jgi:hypothetical protein